MRVIRPIKSYIFLDDSKLKVFRKIYTSLTQKQMANILKIKCESYRYYERGKLPSKSMRDKICDILETDSKILWPDLEKQVREHLKYEKDIEKKVKEALEI